MDGLTIVKNGVSFKVPPEVEAKGDRAVEAWLQSAEAQTSRLEPTEPDAPVAKSRKSKGEE